MNSQILKFKQLNQTDYDLWLLATIALLQNRQLEQLDYENLIEELEALGRNEKNAVKSLSSLFCHLPRIRMNK